MGCLSVSTGFISGIAAFIPLFLLSFDLLKNFTPRFPFVLLSFFIALFVAVIYHAVARSLRPNQVINKTVLLVTGLLSIGFTAALGSFAVLFAGYSLSDLIAPIVTALICSGFTGAMGKRMPYGDRVLAQVLGFREFIAKAEKDKLERMFESDPQYFYRVLPYAIVLRLSTKWAEHFSRMTLSPPAWYRGYSRDRFDSRAFERNLSNRFSSLSSSMCATHSSSSSSGSSGSSSSGGYSGGGSGGGGGQSW